jgi:ribosomal protein S12 methylthiotransferase
MLVGFPGEQDDDIEELLQFIQEIQFGRLGVFTYSEEEGTSAWGLPGRVPEEQKQARAARVMELQENISAEINKKKIGKHYKVLFDRKEGKYFIGRTEADSPEVDNEVLVDASKHFVRVGDFANILITDAGEFDLYGIPA